MFDCSFFPLKNIHQGLPVPGHVLGTRKVEIKASVPGTAHGLVGEVDSWMDNSIKVHNGVSASPFWA